MTMTKFPISGGCHCGAVRFTLHAAPERVVHCHCSICRRLSMSFFQIGAVVRRDDVTVGPGGGNLTSYESSPGFVRQFCRTCGAPLFAFRQTGSEKLYVAATSLDGGLHPGHPEGQEFHIHAGSKAVWERIGEDLPVFEGPGPRGEVA